MTTVAGIILAGGRSSRMGADKAALLLDGQTLLQRSLARLEPAVDELVVVRAPAQRLPAIEATKPLTEVEDPVEGQGPLVGIAAGLAAISSDVGVVVAVDMPFVEPALVRLLADLVAAGHRWVVPIAGRRPQPLCSAFAADVVPVIRAHLDAGDRAPMALSKDLDVYRLQPDEWQPADPTGRSFINVNTPEEFEAIRSGHPLPIEGRDPSDDRQHRGKRSRRD